MSRGEGSGVSSVVVRGPNGTAGINLIRCLTAAGHEVVVHEEPVAAIAEAVVFDAGELGDRLVFTQPDDMLPVQYAMAKWPSGSGGSHFLPKPAVFERCRDKLETANAVGGLAPQSVGGDVFRSSFERFFAQPGAWVRLRHGAGTAAALKVTSVRQVDNWLAWQHAEHGRSADEFMVSEFLPGDDFGVQVLMRDHVPFSVFARQRLSPYAAQASPTGVTSSPALQRSVVRPDVVLTALLALQRVGADQGVYGVDLRCDQAGRPRVTEINAGRFYTTSTFPLALGMNQPDMVVRAAAGEPFEPVNPWRLPYQPGRVWQRIPDCEPRLIA